LLVRNPAAFAARYGDGFNIAGSYAGNLDNSGERVRLVDASGEEILDFNYNNRWYQITDGLGFSLVIVNAIAPIVINEALTRSDVPPPTDSIELFNPTGTNVNIGGSFLSDDFNTPKKFRIPDGTTLSAHG